MKKELKLTINGRPYQISVEPWMTLQDVLRDELKMKGTKKGCETGKCGSCTVILEGMVIKSCLMLALQANGKSILTIEGLSEEDKLHPLQQSFIDHGAAQCGFCTGGMIMTGKDLLDENPNPTEDEVREGLSGNLCRCTGYAGIVEAILGATKR